MTESHVFPTSPLRGLLLREWLQQRTGWLLVLLAPSALLLALALFGHVNVSLHGDDGGPAMAASSAALITTASVLGGMMVLGLGLSLLVAFLQAGGLARRDVQDRSIEFWRALPVPDALALAAPLLAHLVLVPLAGMVAGLLGGLLVSAATVAHADGLGAWLALPWGVLLTAALALALRLAAGLLLALLWLSPLLLAVMVASAWLKRWGVPVLALLLGVVGPLLSKIYGVTVIGDSLRYLLTQAIYGVVNPGPDPAGPLDNLLRALPQLALTDLGESLARLAQPQLAAVLLASAALFGLLLWRRQRTG
jgi:hypothetical protein